MAERLVVERGEQQVDRFVGDLAVDRVGRQRVRVVEAADRHPAERQRLDLARHGAAPQAEPRPAAGEVVQRGEVLREPQRVPLADDVEHRTDPDVRRPLSQERADHQAVRDDLVALELEVVLGEPERVVAELVGQHTGVQHPAGGVHEVGLRVAPVGGSRAAVADRVAHLDRAEQEDTDTHGQVLSPAIHPMLTPSTLTCPCVVGIAPVLAPGNGGGPATVATVATVAAVTAVPPSRAPSIGSGPAVSRSRSRRGC